MHTKRRCDNYALRGTIAERSVIDTSKSGQHEFTVEVEDSAGRSTQVTHTYTVQ